MPDTGARLTILNGPLAGKELALEEAVDNVLIGSDGSCRFHIPSPGISPIHARLWKDAGGITVYDTHSPRGLYINDNRVESQAALKNGDILWLGTPGEEEAVMIQVRLPPRSAEAVSRPATRASYDEPEIVVEPDAFAVAEPQDPDATLLEKAAEDDADATVAEFTPRVSAPMPTSVEPAEFAVAEPEDTEATRLVPGARPAVEPDQQATIAMMPEAVEEPVRFAVDFPTSQPPEPPAFFEDETEEMPPPPAPPPAPWAAPPPPPPPLAPTPAPKPAAAAPPRPAPRVPARAAAPAPPRPAPSARAPSAGGRNLALAAVGALLLAGAGFGAWKLLQGSAQGGEAKAPALAPAPPTTVAPAAPPSVQAVARAPEPVLEPPVEEMVTIVSDAPPTTLAAVDSSPRPTPTAKLGTPPPPTTIPPEVTRAQQAAQQVASLLSRADAAAAARDYAGAAAAYEEVLRLEPSNAGAAEGRAQAQAVLASLKKGFVAGRTTVTGGKAAKGGLSGFDSEDVSVAKALDYSGRIDFEASPRNVKPGDSYNVQVYLTNDGKKGFKIGSVSVTTAVNGARSGGPTAVRVKEVEPGQRVLLTEMPGTWQASTTSWSLEVLVTSSRNDVFRSQLSWR